MSTTSISQPPITLTLDDRMVILRDLAHVTGLGEHIQWIAVQGNRDETSSIYLDDTAHVAPLAVLHDLLDNPRLSRHSDTLYLFGEHRGIRLTAVLSFAEKPQPQPTTERAESALADLKAAVGEDGAS